MLENRLQVANVAQYYFTSLLINSYFRVNIINEFDIIQIYR